MPLVTVKVKTEGEKFHFCTYDPAHKPKWARCYKGSEYQMGKVDSNLQYEWEKGEPDTVGRWMSPTWSEGQKKKFKAEQIKAKRAAVTEKKAEKQYQKKVEAKKKKFQKMFEKKEAMKQKEKKRVLNRAIQEGTKPIADQVDEIQESLKMVIKSIKKQGAKGKSVAKAKSKSVMKAKKAMRKKSK